jgi:hypothetical protein
LLSQSCADASSVLEAPAGTATPAHNGNSRPTRSRLGVMRPISVWSTFVTDAGIAQFHVGAVS